MFLLFGFVVGVYECGCFLYLLEVIDWLLLVVVCCVFDLGVGIGKLIIWLVECGLDVVVVDLILEMLDVLCVVLL